VCGSVAAMTRHVSVLVALGMLTACTASGGTNPRPSGSPAVATLDPGPACVTVEGGQSCLPLAPPGQRVDLVRPAFTNPTAVTNPLFPVGKVTQLVQLGVVEGSRFRAEVTLLPSTKTITWNGQSVTTIESQYMAFLDGRIHEVAIDWYAQADDGAVWYFGEDVFNYDEGFLADTDGTWIAGKDGPAGMIMPAHPKAGDVFRPENAPGIVFEEVTVKSVDQTVQGPRGPVSGAIVGGELHMDGTREDKAFAPGYGEFTTGDPGGDLETAAFAVPFDALGTPTPAQLAAAWTAAGTAFAAAGDENWSGASAAARAVRSAWAGYRAGGVPPLLDKEMSRSVDALAAAVEARDPDEARQAALDVSFAILDLRLRHEQLAAVERARLGVWARQLVLDVDAGEAGDVNGTVETFGRVWDRVRPAIDATAAGRVDSQLQALRAAKGRVAIGPAVALLSTVESL